MEFKLPKLNKPQDLLDFIANDMDSAIHEDTIKSINEMSPEKLSKLESISVSEKRPGSIYGIGRTMTFNYKK